MNCAKCDYDLSGLGAPDRCPECGARDWRPDPDVQTRWSTAERVNLIVALIPAAILLLLHLMLLIARLELGRWPHRGGMDDPKGIPVVRDLHDLVAVLILLVPVAVVTNVAIAFVLFALAGARRQPPYAPLRAFMIAAVLWTGCILVLFIDPAQVLGWFMD